MVPFEKYRKIWHQMKLYRKMRYQMNVYRKIWHRLKNIEGNRYQMRTYRKMRYQMNVYRKMRYQMRNIEKYGTKLDLSKNTVPNEAITKEAVPNSINCTTDQKQL